MPGPIGTPPPTFTQIKAQFGNDPAAKDHNIRFQDGRGLYISSKVSLASLKAFFGFGSQMQARQDKRDAGIKEIKLAIDAEFGDGMGDRAFRRLSRNAIDVSHGIKGSQLKDLHKAIELEKRDQVVLEKQQRTDQLRSEWRTAEKQNQIRLALADENLAHIESQSPPSGTFLKFFSDNFDVCSSAAFFRDNGPQVNADHIGCALSISVLERIRDNGQITEQDLSDLQKALGPYTSDPNDLMKVSTPPAVPAGLVGPSTNDKLVRLTQLVFDRYVAGTGGWELNLSGHEKSSTIDQFNDAPSGAEYTPGRPMTAGEERIKILSEAIDAAASSQGMANGAITRALTAMQV